MYSALQRRTQLWHIHYINLSIKLSDKPLKTAVVFLSNHLLCIRKSVRIWSFLPYQWAHLLLCQWALLFVTSWARSKPTALGDARKICTLWYFRIKNNGIGFSIPLWVNTVTFPWWCSSCLTGPFCPAKIKLIYIKNNVKMLMIVCSYLIPNSDSWAKVNEFRAAHFM